MPDIQALPAPVRHLDGAHSQVWPESASITAGMVERNPESYRKLLELRALVLNSHVVGMFTNAEELERKVEQTLRAPSG